MNSRTLLPVLVLTSPAVGAPGSEGTPAASSAAAAAAPESAETAGEEDDRALRPASAAWGIGAGPIVGIAARGDVANAFFPMGLFLRVHWGAAISENQTSGIAVRGAWLVPPRFQVTSSEHARDLEKIEAGAHWYQEWGDCTRLRFGIGPRVTALLGHEALVNDAAMFGAEGSFDVGLHRGKGPGLQNGVWIGAIAGHARGGEGAGRERDRETTFQVTATFALEVRGRPAEAEPEPAHRKRE